MTDNLYVYVYEQFSLQPSHLCFKIDHVRSSGKFSYMFIMFIVYMVIADEDKKIIWKVVFQILSYLLKNTGVTQTFYGRNADIWKQNKTNMHPIHWNGTLIRELEKCAPDVHDNARNIWRAWSRTCIRCIKTLANNVLIRNSHANEDLRCAI